VNPYQRVSLGILAGGRGSRLQGVDKAFVRYQDQFLSQRILALLTVDFSTKLISAREHDPRFADMGRRPVLDQRGIFLGPLAGIEALLEASETEYLLTVPVDIKYLPVAMIESWLDQPEPPGYVLEDADGLQPLLSLWHVETALTLINNALDPNEKAVHEVVSQLNLRKSTHTDIQYGNLNTPRDFETP